MGGRGWWERDLSGGPGGWKSDTVGGQHLGAWLYSVTVITKGVRKPSVHFRGTRKVAAGRMEGTERQDGALQESKHSVTSI